MSKKTVAAIIASGNHYLIKIKGNQPNLLKAARSISEQEELFTSAYSHVESNRGRTELREVRVFEAPSQLRTDWEGIQQIVQLRSVVSGRRQKGNRPGLSKPTEEIFYLISSRQGLATYYLEGIRLHWAIESSLHYVKDVTMKEDASRIRKGNAPQNISTLRSIALNILRAGGYKNIAAATRRIAHDIPTLRKMIL